MTNKETVQIVSHYPKRYRDLIMVHNNKRYLSLENRDIYDTKTNTILSRKALRDLLNVF